MFECLIGPFDPLDFLLFVFDSLILPIIFHFLLPNLIFLLNILFLGLHQLLNPLILYLVKHILILL